LRASSIRFSLPRYLRVLLACGTARFDAGWCAWLCLGLGSWLCMAARAEPPTRAEAAPASAEPARDQRASYEQRRFDQVLAAHKLTPELRAQGKRIAFVRIVRDDVFVRDEFWPVWLNAVHGITRESVVRRELLFAEGDTYDEARIEESMRNLRGMAIFSLVRIAAVKGAEPDQVGVLVHTRDLWSLRVEDNFSVTHGVINSLLVRVVERNLLGRAQALGADYTLVPHSYQLAQDYYARRLWLSSVALSERAGLVFNQDQNRVEGELASLRVGQPYYRLAQRFAWEAAVLHDRRVIRNISDGQIRFFPPGANGADTALAQEVYRRRSERAYLTGWWRSGDEVKHTLGAGWDYRTLDAHPIAETELPPELDAAFGAVLPASRRDNGPALSYELFVARWVTFVNLATYGQSENVRVGPSLFVSTRAPIRALGSTYNAWSVAGELGLTLAPAGFLFDMRVRGSARLQQAGWIDQYAMFQLRGATPVLWFFRFAARGFLELRRHDSQATNVSLGGDNGLRGYRSQYFAVLGGDRLLANFELRTLPLEWKTIHVGAVIFYDLGAVFAKPSDMVLHHAVGIGLRLLLPQFNRVPSSFDGGVSLPDPRFVLSSFAGASGVFTELDALDANQGLERRAGPLGVSSQ
jgi:hypothetical protein